MTVDWKPRLLEIAKTQSGPALRAAVKDALKAGASVDDVRALSASSPALAALFQDGFDTDVTRRVDLPTGRQGVVGGVKSHVIRAGFSPPTEKSWHKQASLPEAPKSVLPSTQGAPITVDGETFSPVDVAALLRLAA